MPRLPLAPIALQADPRAVLTRAAEVARRVCGADAAFVAVRRSTGQYPIDVRLGLREPAWSHVVIREGLGLGGQVIGDQRPRTSRDYLREPSISADYVPIMRREDLRGVAVVPVADLTAGPRSAPAALMYVSTQRAGAPGDRLVDEVGRAAEMAAVGLAHLDGAAIAVTPPDAAGLTARELEVLGLLGEGCANRVIAERLVIAEPTVKGHVRAILRKLEAPSRLAAVAAGRGRGLL